MPYWFDGNNLIGQSAARARQDPATRRSFLALLSRYATSRGGRFVVFFDGDDPGRGLPPRGVRVRYSAPRSADDAILGEAEGARSRAEIIVVTNDQGLRASCRSAGLRTMNWREFTEKMSASPQAYGKVRPSEEKVDVEDWSRFFGFDPKNLK